MDIDWKELDHDPVSGRKIFEAPDKLLGTNSPMGGHSRSIAKQFEVCNPKGEVLLKAFGDARGEYWAGVSLFFVKGTDGKRVRLDEPDSEDKFCDVPDTPSDPPAVLKHYE